MKTYRPFWSKFGKPTSIKRRDGWTSLFYKNRGYTQHISKSYARRVKQARKKFASGKSGKTWGEIAREFEISVFD